ncbi:hypothetical protein Sango_2307900 [Sesamum angolense]|uniref:Uncharacterized protein n=1 Tax=Sesamum angolense TaxID=2727404 RepID=A0AAE1WAB9_9LAMI|nr:hypothetical protein Sango_2307900 [Sesamum angolense]
MTDKEARIPICKSWVIPPIFSDDEDDMLQEEENHVTEVFEVEEEDWRQPLVDYLRYGKLPNDLRRRTDTRRRATRFIYYKGTLYRRSFDGLFLRCLSDNEKVQAMEEAHSGAYRTTVRTPIQATPYALVYGVEAVLPLEQQIPSLRIAIQEGLTEEENAQIRLEELEALDEKRLEAQQRLECYQARLSRAFNKKVRLCSFQVGDLVLAVRRPIITTHRTGNKFLPKWDGPYVVKEAYTNGAYKLIAEDGLRIGPINEKFLKRYYA